ncbi:MAG: type VI secretion system baseplate subunit TssF [Planctomycetota bacterium]|nr:type VI secretion system baseplate subunit TssF [Planctomycetota bacterium]
MDRQLFDYYEKELQYLRGTGAEFAAEYPRIASRLGLSSQECSDPYVERLLEGVAFLSARVQLKLDAEFPTFTQSLLEAVCPDYLAPTPSMCIVRFEPDAGDSSLAEGVRIPRKTTLRGQIGPDEQTPCIYSTAQEVTLWPITVAQATYSTLGTSDAQIRLVLESPADVPLKELPMESLSVYFGGSTDVALRIFEACCARAKGVSYSSPDSSWSQDVGPRAIYPLGFDEEHALLPVGPRSFSGYRLLHEYFALPDRFRMVRFEQLAPALQRCEGNRLEITIHVARPLSKRDTDLERTFSTEHVQLFCTPAINLFERQSGRVQLNEIRREHLITIDRTRPLDFEVHSVKGVVGFDDSNRAVQEFSPLFGARGGTDGQGCYTVRRQTRLVSTREKRVGSRTRYLGGDVYLSVSDPDMPPISEDVRQLGVRVYATNRDLPLTMPVGVGPTDFSLEDSFPVRSTRVVSGPTPPAPSPAVGEVSWRLISHLTLNYLSLLDEDDAGATALRGLLSLYVHAAPAGTRHQINGLRSASVSSAIDRAPRDGPIAFIRGLDVRLEFDESRFEGASPFVLASVIDRFLPRYVSINSFTRTHMYTADEGELAPWPIRTGSRGII